MGLCLSPSARRADSGGEGAAVSAREAGVVFWKFCRRSRRGIVHSVFDRIINLKVCGQMLSLAAYGAGGDSHFLMLDVRSLRQFAVAAGDPCTLDRTHVRIGGLCVDLSSAGIWHGPLPPGKQAQACPGVEKRLQEVCRRLQGKPGLAPALYEAQMEGLRRKEAIEGAVRGLVGLGPGLTPSGDDMLVGFVAVYNYMGRDWAMRERLHKAILEQLGRTGELSAAVLKNALACDYHEVVQEVILALGGGNKGELDERVARLLKVGATSGADMALGMYYALRCIAGESGSGDK